MPLTPAQRKGLPPHKPERGGMSTSSTILTFPRGGSVGTGSIVKAALEAKARSPHRLTLARRHRSKDGGNGGDEHGGGNCSEQLDVILRKLDEKAATTDLSPALASKLDAIEARLAALEQSRGGGCCAVQ